MSDKHLQALYGAKYDPFSPKIPVEDLWRPPGAEAYFERVRALAPEGGFSCISGEPGLGKSKILQLLDHRLQQIGELVVGVMERPQSRLGDFYREMGDLFGVDLTPVNRYGGFKALRSKWRGHIKSTLFRPILLIDEAQEVATACLNELRLLGSAHFDSESLLTVVLCGDTRLTDRFRSRDLLPLGSRIRTRLVLEPLGRDDLLDFLDHLLERAGVPHLMSDGLRATLVDHAAGNPRVLVTMGAELLATAVSRDQATLDEQLFVEVFSRQPKPRRSRGQQGTKAA